MSQIAPPPSEWIQAMPLAQFKGRIVERAAITDTSHALSLATCTKHFDRKSCSKGCEHREKCYLLFPDEQQRQAFIHCYRIQIDTNSGAIDWMTDLRFEGKFSNPKLLDYASLTVPITLLENRDDQVDHDVVLPLSVDAHAGLVWHHGGGSLVIFDSWFSRHTFHVYSFAMLRGNYALQSANILGKGIRDSAERNRAGADPERVDTIPLNTLPWWSMSEITLASKDFEDD